MTREWVGRVKQTVLGRLADAATRVVARYSPSTLFLDRRLFRKPGHSPHHILHFATLFREMLHQRAVLFAEDEFCVRG